MTAPAGGNRPQDGPWAAVGRHLDGYDWPADRGPRGFKVAPPSMDVPDLARRGAAPIGVVAPERLLADGDVVVLPGEHPWRVEAEVCWIVGGALGGEVSEAEIRASIAGVAPALEISEVRLGPEATVEDHLADGVAQWGIGIGREVSADLARSVHGATLVVGAAVHGRQVDPAAVQDPIAAISRLCRTLGAFDLGLVPGDRIITGALAYGDLTPGVTVTGRFEAIGEVTIEFGVATGRLMETRSC